MLHPLLAHPARLGRRRPRRALRPDERLDVPLGRARRPAAELAGADADDDELGRPLPHARGGGGARDGLARGRVAAPCIVARAAGGDHAPGGLGEDVRPSARARLGGGGAGALPADVDGRRPRSRVSPERRLHRSEPAHVRARRGCAASRRRGQHQHAGHGHHDGARRGDGGRHRQGRDRDRHRDQRRRDVRPRDRRARRCHGADHPDGTRVPRPRALRPPARHADDARPVAARLLPARVGRPDHGRLRAQLRPLVARWDPGGLQRQAARGGLAAIRGADGERDRSRPDASKAWASSS